MEKNYVKIIDYTWEDLEKVADKVMWNEPYEKITERDMDTMVSVIIEHKIIDNSNWGCYQYKEYNKTDYEFIKYNFLKTMAMFAINENHYNEMILVETMAILFN